MLDYALNKARKLPYTKGQSRVYAIVTDKRGRIVSQGANSYVKTSTHMHRASRKLGLVKDYCHAEMVALVRAKGNGSKLYVARVNAKGGANAGFPLRGLQGISEDSRAHQVNRIHCVKAEKQLDSQGIVSYSQLNEYKPQRRKENGND